MTDTNPPTTQSPRPLPDVGSFVEVRVLDFLHTGKLRLRYKRQLQVELMLFNKRGVRLSPASGDTRLHELMQDDDGDYIIPELTLSGF